MPGRRLTPDSLRRQIAGGDLDPVYLVHGEDHAEKTTLAAAFASAIEEDVRAFNVERFYGTDTGTTIAGLVDSARTLPWLSSRRVILVLHAEKLLMPRSEDESAQRDLDLLDAYIKAPQPHAVMVFVTGALDRRRRGVAQLMKHATVVECSGLQDARDASAWIRARVAEAGAKIDAGAVRLLAERAGHDIGRLRADLDRLLMFVAGERPITAADVEETAGGPTLKDDWEMARAIESGSAPLALRQLALLLDGGTAPLKVLGQLGWIVRLQPPKGRFPAARIPAAVDALFRTDLAIKTSAGDPRVLLERLVVELCEATRPAAGPRPQTARR